MHQFLLLKQNDRINLVIIINYRLSIKMNKTVKNPYLKQLKLRIRMPTLVTVKIRPRLLNMKINPFFKLKQLTPQHRKCTSSKIKMYIKDVPGQ